MKILAPFCVLADLLYPRRCPFCDAPLGVLSDCPQCAPQRERLAHRPSRIDPAEHFFGGITGAAAAYYYEEQAAQAVRRCKFSARPWYAREMGRQIVQQVFGYQYRRRCGVWTAYGPVDYRSAYDLIVPVPHTDRLRGYPVPELIAREIAEALKIPLCTRALHKKYQTVPQASLSGSERLTNLVGAFEVRGNVVGGKRILLVDDVITTGATVSCCAQALLKGGAQEVFAVGFAVSERGGPIKGE